jgi:hypothetical protein
MHRALLAAASMAAIVITSPASGQGFAAGGFSSSLGTSSMTGLSRNPPLGRDIGRPGGKFHHRRHIRVGDGIFYSGYNDFGDYDANRSFDPDRWNDWWHDRPERSFPRWMARNQGCERPWYSGDVLVC